jgi:hypothetical protein
MMSKGQRGNKEAKKPKQAAPVVKLPAAPSVAAATLGIKPAPPRK